MGKKPKRRMGKYIRGNIDEGTSLSATLAALTGVTEQFDDVVNERTLVSSVVAVYSLGNATPVAAAGPIMVGVAHGDYSLAEIEEWIETTGSWNETDLIEQEVAGRKIRRVGVFAAPRAVEDEVTLNDGKPIKTKLNWILTQGQTLQLWAYNTGTAAMSTTVSVVRAQGHANLWPR